MYREVDLLLAQYENLYILGCLPIFGLPGLLALATYLGSTLGVPLPSETYDFTIGIIRCGNFGVAWASCGMSHIDDRARLERRFEVGRDEKERRGVFREIKWGQVRF